MWKTTLASTNHEECSNCRLMMYQLTRQCKLQFLLLVLPFTCSFLFVFISPWMHCNRAKNRLNQITFIKTHSFRLIPVFWIIWWNFALNTKCNTENTPLKCVFQERGYQSKLLHIAMQKDSTKYKTHLPKIIKFFFVHNNYGKWWRGIQWNFENLKLKTIFMSLHMLQRLPRKA